jgi:hypothetical protein
MLHFSKEGAAVALQTAQSLGLLFCWLGGVMIILPLETTWTLSPFVKP